MGPGSESPACPYCGLIMTLREMAELGACTDCYRGLVMDMGDRW